MMMLKMLLMIRFMMLMMMIIMLMLMSKLMLMILFSGDELYNCVWFSAHGSNIMEFQLGLRPSQSPSFQHCDNDHFLQRTWFTQVN